MSDSHYAITQTYHSSITGGYYLCSVYKFTHNFDMKISCKDITQLILQNISVRYSSHKGQIKIPHGSGTGFMVLKDLIMKLYPDTDYSDIFLLD